MSNNVDKIKDRLNIVDIVSSYLKLEKAGINLKAPCPFHNEKTPSFFVSPDRGTYKCFGCGAGGDIFTFVEQFEGVDFMGALKILAEKAGVELEKEDQNKKNEKNRSYTAMEETTLFFENELSQRSDALKYLEGRGISAETIKNFRIGFSKDEWRNLYNHLKEKKFTGNEMEKVGLVKETDKGFYDIFRGRIIFPIFDNSGRVVAFSGRLFNGNEKSAKYLNSPETVLFNKSKILYGYNFAKNDIRKRDFSILVEGQVDLIIAHQFGFTNTIATSGTSVTDDHLEILKRLSNNLLMAYDGDNAGITAANRGAKLALTKGMEVKLVEIPDNLDPADFIIKDKDGWVRAIQNSSHIIDFNLNSILKNEKNSRDIVIKVKKIILPLVKGIESKMDQGYFVSIISQKTGIAEDIIWEDLKNIDSEEISNKRESVPFGNKVKKNLTLKQKALREISGILFWQKTLSKSNIDILDTENRLNDIIGESIFLKIKEISEEVKSGIIFEVENLYTDVSKLKEKLGELFLRLEIESLKEERDKIKKKIDIGENNEEDLKEYKELSNKIELKIKS